MSPKRKRDLLQRVRREDEAFSRVETFARRFTESHVVLAMHAAIPAGLSPELVHLLRANFVPGAPFIAEADLLLSPLCREVGGGLYEMDADVREVLHSELDADPEFGRGRIRLVSEFLYAFADRGIGIVAGEDARAHLRTLQWVALANLRPDAAAQQLASALKGGIATGNKGETLRVVRLTDSLAGALAGQDVLLRYAAGLGRLVRGRADAAARVFRGIGSPSSPPVVGGVALPSPDTLLTSFESAEKSAATITGYRAARIILTGLAEAGPLVPLRLAEAMGARVSSTEPLSVWRLEESASYEDGERDVFLWVLPPPAPDPRGGPTHYPLWTAEDEIVPSDLTLLAVAQRDFVNHRIQQRIEQLSGRPPIGVVLAVLAETEPQPDAPEFALVELSRIEQFTHGLVADRVLAGAVTVHAESGAQFDMLRRELAAAIPWEMLALAPSRAAVDDVETLASARPEPTPIERIHALRERLRTRSWASALDVALLDACIDACATRGALRRMEATDDIVVPASAFHEACAAVQRFVADRPVPYLVTGSTELQQERALLPWSVGEQTFAAELARWGLAAEIVTDHGPCLVFPTLFRPAPRSDQVAADYDPGAPSSVHFLALLVNIATSGRYSVTEVFHDQASVDIPEGGTAWIRATTNDRGVMDVGLGTDSESPAADRFRADVQRWLRRLLPDETSAGAAESPEGDAGARATAAADAADVVVLDACVRIGYLGENGPTATGVFVSPQIVVTAAQPFVGVPILGVDAGNTAFHAESYGPFDEGVEDVRFLRVIGIANSEPARVVDELFSYRVVDGQTRRVVPDSIRVLGFAHGEEVRARGKLQMLDDPKARFFDVLVQQDFVPDELLGAAVANGTDVLGIVTHIDRERDEGTILRAASGPLLHELFTQAAAFERHHETPRGDVEEELAAARSSGDDRRIAEALVDAGGADVRLGKYEAALMRYEEALRILTGIGDSAGLARTHELLGDALLALERLPEAETHFRKAVDLHTATADTIAAGWALGRLGNALLLAGRSIEASDTFQQQIDAGRRASDPTIELQGLANSASARIVLGDIAAAQRDLELRLELARRVDEPPAVAEALLALGRLLESTRELDRAVHVVEEALSLLEPQGETAAVGYALLQLGRLRGERKELESAFTCFERARDIARQLEDAPLELDALAATGDVHLRADHLEAADRAYAEQLERARAAEHLTAAGAALTSLAHVRAMSDDWTGALRLYGEAVDVYRQTRDDPGLRHALGQLGNAHLALQQWSAAASVYQELLELAGRSGDEYRAASAAWGQGEALAHLGDVERAAPLLQRWIDYLHSTSDPDATSWEQRAADLLRGRHSGELA